MSRRRAARPAGIYLITAPVAAAPAAFRAVAGPEFMAVSYEP